MSEATLPTAAVGTGPWDDTLATHVLDLLLSAEDIADPSADRGKERVLEVAQVFGDAVVDLKHFAPGRAVQLGATLVRSLRGTRMQEDFFVPTSLLAAGTHPLFEAEGRGWVCVVQPEWDGFVEGPAGRRSLPALAALVGPGVDGLVRLPIGPEDRAVVIVGGTTFVARPVHPSKRVPIYGGAGIDYPLLGITGFIGFAAMLLGVALSVVPSSSRASTMTDEDRLVQILLEQAAYVAPVPVAEAVAPKAAPKGKEGKHGRPDSQAPKDRDPISKADRDQHAAKNAGLLGALQDDANLASMLGDAGLPGELANGVGAMIGPRATQLGSGGLGSRNGGFGGGGTADSMGGIGPIGRGRPGGSGFAPTGGPGKQTGTITSPDTTIVMGGLDRSQIDEVVKRGMSQIRYCYQRELTKNPALGGKVTVKFTIAGDGSVSSAVTKTSTLGNPAVESCINGRFLRFGFPAPKGNGLVIVSYPFLFSPG
ncbi:MAG: AgmX/PglI C-terminal domain-containing protein [Pseudomonadota bacterium]|nr:AgmX/PglI C-terminal domain-containing protein [Pseudomonadota bacterium]